MTTRKSKAGSTLRQLKLSHQQQIQQLKHDFEQQLLAVEQSLEPLFYSQCFYHEAMMNLLTSDNEPDSDSLIGAMVIQRWLRQSGHSLMAQLATMQYQLNEA